MLITNFLPDQVSIYFCKAYAIYEEKIIDSKEKKITSEFVCKVCYTRREHDDTDINLQGRAKKAVKFKLELIKKIGEISK